MFFECFGRLQAVVSEAGVQDHPQKFWFVESPGKIPENLGKNGAQCCLTSKNGAQRLQKNMKAFLEVTPKKVFSSWSLWEKISRQKSHNSFLGKFGEIRAKILRIPKILLAPTPMVASAREWDFTVQIVWWYCAVSHVRGRGGSS